MDRFTQWLSEYREDPDYLFELASLAVSEAVVERMNALGVTRTELAQRLGVSRPRVTQILAGDDNLTLKKLVALANALETNLGVTFSARSDRIQPVPLDLAGWTERPKVAPAEGTSRQLATAA